MTTDRGADPSPPLFRVTRRGLGIAACTALTAPIAAKLAWDRFEGFRSANVFIAGVPTYETDLRSVMRTSLTEIGFSAARVKGKSVLLKPNLIEPASQDQAVLTHPAVIHAAAEAFLTMGAREVVVGDGPGHCRDARLVAEVGGLKPILRDLKIRFVDLNHGPIVTRRNALGMTGLSHLHLSEAVAAADILVSVAKLKTHHWAGVTLSMKNLFGTLPGICYGWPKNIFHQMGINPSILDVNATLKPHLAIIDGVIGMEGDGPIMGTPRRAGVVVVGDNPVAVDATATRLIGGYPDQIDHLLAAAGVLGPIREEHIDQRGDPILRHATRFRLPATEAASAQAHPGG
jgi:uncharacterized protein (DUF362 family)